MEDRRDHNPDDLLDRAVDAVMRDPIPDDAPPDRVAQLAALVRRAADQPYPITIIERISHMKPMTRIAVAATVLAVFVGLIPWLAPGNGTGLALANVAEALTDVQSARWKTTVVAKWPQGEARTMQEIGMFLAPSHERKETTIEGETSIAIFDARKDRALALLPAKKIAHVLNFKNSRPGTSGTTFLDLRKTVMDAQRGGPGRAQSVGVQVIDGRRAEGFRVQSGATEVTIWADPKTSLPIRVESFMSGATEVRMVMTDFEIGVDLDESLFSLEVPEGYTVQEMQLKMPKKPLVLLARTLGLAAEHNGGVFPQSLRGEHGIDGILSRIAPALEKKYGKDSPELMKAGSEIAANGAGALVILNRLSPQHDWHYAGKHVKLNEPNRPIFWWKPQMIEMNEAVSMGKSGDYEVIYADLSVKDVAPEDVPRVPEDIAEAETFQLPDVDEAAFVDGMRAWLEAKDEAQAGIDRMKQKAQQHGVEFPGEMSAFFERAAWDAGYPERLDVSWLVDTFCARALMIPGLKPIPDDLTEEERAKLTRARGREAAMAAGQVMREASLKATAVAAFYQKLENEQREPEYFGATVKPGDAVAILLKWRLDNGRYRIIYGDLRADTVDSAD